MNIFQYPITDGNIQKYVITSGDNKIVLDLESAKRVAADLNFWIASEDEAARAGNFGPSLLERAYPEYMAIQKMNKSTSE